MQRWLEKWPDKATFVRFAGEGDWLHQFRSVILIRISPFPYIIFNYAAVATNVDYGPYISGSVVGTVHEIYITIYRLVNSQTLVSYCTNLFYIMSFCLSSISLANYFSELDRFTIHMFSLHELVGPDYHCVKGLFRFICCR